MPQMSPFNWIYLYLMFVLTLVITMMKIYTIISTATSIYIYNTPKLQTSMMWTW